MNGTYQGVGGRQGTFDVDRNFPRGGGTLLVVSLRQRVVG